MQTELSRKRLKILFLTPRFIYPTIGGDRLKPYYLLSHLCKYHDVTLVSFFQGGLPPKSFTREVEKLGCKLVTIPLLPFKAGLRSFFKIFSKKPLEILYYTQPEFTEAVQAIIKEEKIDLAFSFFMRTAEYLKDLQVKKILMAEDCRTLYQKRSYQQTDHLLQKFIRWWEYFKLKKYEPEICNHFDIVTLVTKEDIESMSKQNSACQYRYLTNGVDLNKFEMPDSTEKREGILFAGKLDVWANVLMLQRIASEILPIIRKHVPNVKFDIVGANPPQQILNLKCKDIEIHSNVPDMKPFLQKAAVFIHPHNGGSGIQNKLLEAMASGCPVVTTNTGIQGIDARHGVEALIGNTSAEIAEHTVTLLQNQYFAQEIAENARLLIETTHSWDSVYHSIDVIINEAMAVKKTDFKSSADR